MSLKQKKRNPTKHKEIYKQRKRKSISNEEKIEKTENSLKKEKKIYRRKNKWVATNLRGIFFSSCVLGYKIDTYAGFVHR